MPRVPVILALLALTAQPALPQAILPTPLAPKILAPGKPAGVTAAQHISYRQGFIAVSVIAVVLTFTLPASSSTATSTATTS